jgi:hypothetical protein
MAAHLNAHRPAAASRWVVPPTRLSNETAIHYHAHAADAHHLERALSARGDPDGAALIAHFSPPLHLAAAAGCEACVELLLARGATLTQDSKRRGGRTALHQAAIAGAPKCVELLLEAGEDANARDAAGATTALHAAAFAGHTAVVAVLLERGADATLRSKAGETPLHAACRGRRDAVVALLAKHVAHDKAIAQLPGVVAQLTAPLQRGDLYSRPSQLARAGGGEACAAPIDAIVRDCQARLYPKDPREAGKPWAKAIASRHHGTPRRPPPEKLKAPVNATTARAKPLEDKATLQTRTWSSSAHGHVFGQTRCVLCDPIAKDERGRRCNASHGTGQHAAWTDMRRAHLRRKRKEDRLARNQERLAPGEVPWNPH